MAYLISESSLTATPAIGAKPRTQRIHVIPKNIYRNLIHYHGKKNDDIIDTISINSKQSPFQRFDARFKIVLLGDSGVGKTSIIRAAMGKQFSPTMISTIGIDFVNQNFEVDHQIIQLQIWDTAGQERYRSLSASNFRNAKGFIVVYDITSRQSFDKIREEWLHTTDIDSYDPVPVFIAGNKSDLETHREVSTSEAKLLCERQFAHGFFETSALTGSCVREMFQRVAETMLSTWGIRKLNDVFTSDGSDLFDLREKPDDKIQKKHSIRPCCH